MLSQHDAAQRLGVSRRSVQRARKVLEQGVPELAEKVRKGELPVRVAAPIAELIPAW